MVELRMSMTAVVSTRDFFREDQLYGFSGSSSSSQATMVSSSEKSMLAKLGARWWLSFVPMSLPLLLPWWSFFSSWMLNVVLVVPGGCGRDEEEEVVGGGGLRVS